MRLVLMLLFFSGNLMLAQNANLPSAATMGTGTDLVHQCQCYDRQLTKRGAADIAVEAQEIGYGTGYCFGVITTSSELLQVDGEIHLPSGGITFEQVKKIVTNYLDAHPEEWQKPASVVVTKALKQAWGGKN